MNTKSLSPTRHDKNKLVKESNKKGKKNKKTEEN
jgi:hypothetical protein